jgi:hypothetical protein
MFFAYQRKRSVVGWVPPPSHRLDKIDMEQKSLYGQFIGLSTLHACRQGKTFYDKRMEVEKLHKLDSTYHDFHRGWIMRSLQNKLLAKFKDSSFEIDPAFEQPSIYDYSDSASSFPSPYNRDGREMCWVCGKETFRIFFYDYCTCFSRRMPLDQWLRCLSFVNNTGCVTLEFNAKRGMLISCCTTKIELYDQIDGAIVATDPNRLSDYMEVFPGARNAVNVCFRFGASFKRADYVKLEKKVYVSLKKILRLLEGAGCKRAKTEA